MHVVPEADSAIEEEGLAVEFLEAHVLALRQGVVLGRREVQALAHEQDAVHAWRLTRAYGQVDQGVEEGALDVGLIAHHLGAHERPGHTFHDERGEKPQRGRGDGPHAQHALAARRVKRCLAHASLGGDELLGMGKKLAPHAAEGQGVPDAVEERRTQLLLEVLDGAAEGRLRYVLLACGSGDRSRVRDGDEVAYLVGVHAGLPLLAMHLVHG